jgi:putative SOS response-associated peptidase YedK
MRAQCPAASPSSARHWLATSEELANDNELKAMLKPFPSERMSAWPVGKAVGNVKNDAPNVIEHTPIQAMLI